MNHLNVWKVRLFGRLSWVVIGLVCAGNTLAAVDIPEALTPWKSWVLHGQESWLCPEVAGGHRPEFCAWPGELKLEARADGARFTQSWEIQRESAAPLPGNREYWPQQVTVDDAAYPVPRRNGAPVVWLSPGKHVVSGWIPWLERPQTLAVPESVALVSLTLDGKPAPSLQRQGAWLSLGKENARADAREGDSVEFQVYRKLVDGIPARLITRVQFKVSGKARELSVADVLPERFVPVHIASSWTARLDPNGRLQVQALPGQATVEIEARLDEPLASVIPRLTSERPQEVWSYEAVPALRTTSITPDGDDEAAYATDPRQAGVPVDWLLLPAFVVNAGARLKVEERARGQNERENQRLTLQREMWLDFSGEGFFARDRIEGYMRQGWRFDVAQPYTLERADSLTARAANANWGGRQLASNALGGAPGLLAALLVTRLDDERLSGVEWRQPEVTLNAGVRLAASASGRIPVTGWRQSFDSVDTTLHLPYGYRFIAASGVDSASGNIWVERWTILDIFLAAFFTLLAWRLLGAGGGLIAGCYLAMAMQEPMSPLYSIAVVSILALLRREMPEGRLRRFFQNGERLALLCLVGVAVIFIPTQIRYALYPQLEEGGGLSAHYRNLAVPAPSRDDVMYEAADEAEEDADKVAGMRMATRAPMVAAVPRMALSYDSKAQSQSERALRQRYAQSTVTQTGGAEPAWALGQHYQLHWSGPVVDTQSVRLLISPPWLTRLLRVAMLALLGLLGWKLVRQVFPANTPPPARADSQPLPSHAAAPLAAVGLAILLAAMPGFSAPAAAQSVSAFPPAELLEGLKTRLLKAPDCAPNCVAVASARVEAETGL
ncbi:MAG: hypothetical protein LBU43_07510, partial [Candidatus Accumulibacter sp.]|nr:hypothetical protein [Accumulibacter sp.]